MDPALRAMLGETITQRLYLSQDVAGAPSYGLPFTRPARLQWKPQRITIGTGEERVSRAKIFLEPTPTITVHDRLTLPDGTSPPLLLIYPAHDEQSVLDHYEVYI